MSKTTNINAGRRRASNVMEGNSDTYGLNMVAEAVSETAQLPRWVAFEIAYHRFDTTDLHYLCDRKGAQKLLTEMESIKHEYEWDDGFTDAEKIAFAFHRRNPTPEPGDSASEAWGELMSDVVLRLERNSRRLEMWMNGGEQ